MWGYLSSTIKLLQLWRINAASEKQVNIPSTHSTLLLFIGCNYLYSVTARMLDSGDIPYFQGLGLFFIFFSHLFLFLEREYFMHCLFFMSMFYFKTSYIHNSNSVVKCTIFLWKCPLPTHVLTHQILILLPRCVLSLFSVSFLKLFSFVSPLKFYLFC